MSDIYMQNILDHFKNPENYGELEAADVVQKEHNPLCGDKLTVYLDFDGEVLKNVKFEGNGCAISQAAMSMLTEEILGKTKSDILAIDKDFVVEMLGIQLSPTRLKCALLGLQAVHNGINN
jgi:nitrogen fixation NifU-like protein